MSNRAACLAIVASAAAAGAEVPEFTAVQPQLFTESQALSNAFADVDSDGDLDLAVSFENGAIRLYRNDAGTFVEAGAELGLVVSDADSRQANWVDYDRDGDLDLFSAQRSGINRMFRNDGGQFTDVSGELGLADPRRTVGSCWFDMDQDGDLDVFQANQQADKDTLYRNDGTTFTDVAPQLGMHQPERTLAEGGVGCTVGDYDNDGLLDLFVATYGTTLLYRNLGSGTFRDVAAETGVQLKLHAVGASWADVDNDGYLDLYVAAYVDGENWSSRAHLFMNRQGEFVDSLGEDSAIRAADHGVQWADFDRDGDLDLSLTDDFPENGRHPLFRNELPKEVAGRSLQVRVLDREGRATQAGAEARLYGVDGNLLGTRLVPTGDGYGSQSDVPVHFGLAKTEVVTVEVTFLTRDGRKRKRVERVDPRKWSGRALVVKAD